MRVVLKSLFWWTLLGVLLGFFGGAVYYGYQVVVAGYSLDSVPVYTLLIEVMGLHILALKGGAAGLAFGFLMHMFSWLKVLVLRLRRGTVSTQDSENPDGIIRAERERKADEYLSGRESRTLDTVIFGEEGDEGAPDVENIITARNGTYTYRILAYRHLSDTERISIVKEALKHGQVQEPEPGATATILTSIGRLRD